MKRFLNLVKNIFVRQPLLLLLVIILSTITLTSIRPNLYLMGWDNFSSYLNLPISIGNSLSGPWRDYRGLGVASDSEVVDLFHQLFVLPFTLILPVNLLDQIYLIFSLWGGVLLMYWFSYRLFSYLFDQTKGTALKLDLGRYTQLFAFLASFFYLFNLNTLSVFYFPILPYISRFMAIPALQFIAFYFMTTRQWSKKWVMLSVLGILMMSTSYVTATVFITVVVSLFIHAVCYRNWKRLILFFSLLVGLNLFWLLPFGNYVWQKSGVVQMAPSNIEGNESLLNRSGELYKFSKQSIFYPNFFDIHYTDSATKESLPFHPLTAGIERGWTGIVLHLFPFLYLTGGLAIIFEVLRRLWSRSHESRRLGNQLFILLWIPFQTIFFVLLSMKEYGPIGPIYELLSKYLPFFDILFRFGDTKFHPFVVFSAALAAAFGLVYLLNLVRLKVWGWLYPLLRTGVLLSLIIATLLVFKTYLTGSFVGYFMYTQLPEPYLKIAQTINADPDPVRVLHLPFDKFGYWRPYTWGYFGSSFFSYLINKPYLDRTFEPGSLENASLDNRIYQLIETLPLQDEEGQRRQVDQLYQILKDNNIKYLIDDETVNTQVLAQGQTYWGSLPLVQTRMLFELLVRYGYVQEQARYSINPYDYLRYSPGNGRELYVSPDVSLPQDLVLYQLTQTDDRIEFSQWSIQVDGQLTNLAETDIYPTQNESTLLQSDQGGLIVPFKRSDAMIKLTDQRIDYQLKVNPSTNNNYQLIMPAAGVEDGRLLKVLASRNGNNLNLEIVEVLAPEINGQKFEQSIGKVEFELGDEASTNLADLRLKLDNNLIKLPSNLGSQSTDLGVVLIHQSSVVLQLLTKDQQQYLTTGLFKPTDPTDCLDTKLTDYRAFVSGDSNKLTITSRNGSTCVIGDLQQVIQGQLDYGEMIINAEMDGVDLDNVYRTDRSHDTALAKQVIELPKPNSLYACIEYYGAAPCGNPVRNYSFNGSKTLVLPIQDQVTDTNGMRLVMALRNTGYQEQKIVVNQMELVSYKLAKDWQINLANSQQLKLPINLGNVKQLDLNLPQTITRHSLYNTVESYDLSLAVTPCEDPAGYRTTRVVNDQFVTYTRRCGNGLFISRLPMGNDMYIWAVDYNLVSGQFPTIRISDTANEYLNQRISLSQGYPKITDFKSGRVDGSLSTTVGSTIFNDLQNTEVQKSKILAFSQYSENDGVVITKSNNIVALPKQWNNLALIQTDRTDQYQLPSGYKYSQILPGLWRITIDKNSPTGNYLLVFKEGFDRQWSMYEGLGKALFGIGQQIDPTRCNGLHNCYQFSLSATNDDQAMYLIYSPLRLSAIGALLTLLVVVGVGMIGWRYSKRN